MDTMELKGAPRISAGTAEEENRPPAGKFDHEFRRNVVERMKTSEDIAALARELKVSRSQVYRLRNESLGRIPVRRSSAELEQKREERQRRQIADLERLVARQAPELIVEAFPQLSRFGVMKHIDVLRAAGLINAREEGRQRVNSLNAVPIRQIYERWVSRYEGFWADRLLRLQENVEAGAPKRGPLDPSVENQIDWRVRPR